tara:strand:- start:259 stop:1167 length:909 start_codon:yes stop_codon:yes gene_type:complete
MGKVLIAGGSGVIGSFLLSALGKDFSIISINKSIQNFSEKSFPLDLTDLKSIEAFIDKFRRFNVIIFLVGLAHKKGIRREIDLFKQVNYQTLINMLSIMEKKHKLPKKIIFASTISVYGEKFGKEIYNENSNKDPISPYAITKLESEEYLIDKFSNRLWILRFAPVYSSKFLLNINRRTKYFELFFKVGDGNKKLSLCNIGNIENVVRGILKNQIPNGVYNVSDYTEYTYNDLLSYSKAKRIIRIPQFLLKLFYIVSLLIKNNFLKENIIKLVSNNIYPSNKIRKFITLPFTLNSKTGIPNE